MKQSDKVQRAIGYKAGIERSIEIWNFIDRNTDMKIPLALWGLLKREISRAEDFIGENK